MFGRLFLSANYMCFLSDEPDACSVVLPLRDVQSIEPADTGMSTGTPKRKGMPAVRGADAVCIMTARSHFILGSLQDPSVLITMVNQYLPVVRARAEEREHAQSLPVDPAKSVPEPVPVLTAPLYKTFGTACGKVPAPPKQDESTPLAAVKEHLWELHFSEYGHGISMFRSRRDRDLIMKGVPDNLRREVWMLHSGALNDLTENPGCAIPRPIEREREREREER